jgi:hypothetical protein
MTLPPKPTLRFTKVKGSSRAHIAQIGKATMKMGNVTFEWHIFRRGRKGRVTIKKKGKFLKQLKKWKRTKGGKLKKIDISRGKVELIYETGHGSRKEIIELIDRGPKKVRGNISRYALTHTMYSGSKRLSRKTKTIGNYREAGAYVTERTNDLKKSLTTRPSYHIVRAQHLMAVVPFPKKQVSKHGQGHESVAAAKKEIRDQFDTMSKDFSLLRTAYNAHKASLSPTVLSSFKHLPKYYVRTIKKRKIAGTQVEVRSFTKRKERQPTKLAEHVLYKLVRWKKTWKYAGRTRSRWNEVGWLLLRWGQGKGYGRTVPTYTVVDPKGKEIDFRVPLTPKESEQLSREKTRLWGVNFVRRPAQAARAYIEKDIKRYFAKIETEVGKSSTKDPDYFKRGRKEATEYFGNVRVKIVRYGFLKKPVSSQRGLRIIGGLIVEKYKKGKKSPERRWHWQLQKQTKKGGKYIVTGTRVSSERFTMKRNARRHIMARAEEVIDRISRE